MNTQSNSYVLGFAVLICVAMSASLALVANSLKETQKAAAEFDRQKNVMMAAGLLQDGDPRPRAELEALYKQRIQEETIETKAGTRQVAMSKAEDGKVETFILPISGKGLWSTIYGYLALESDKNTVRGVTFYKHGETPGLGGECENPVWCAQWKGKKVRADDGKLRGIQVYKGQAPQGSAWQVDGLSGATITSNGITKFVQSDLDAFADFLNKSN